jgi:hypothetical protein
MTFRGRRPLGVVTVVAARVTEFARVARPGGSAGEVVGKVVGKVE